MDKQVKISAMLLAPALLALALEAGAAIPGIGRVAGDGSCSGTDCTFDLTASSGQIVLGDGNTLLAWGYGTGAQMQYPGPTLIVNQGDTVTVNLTNTLRLPASIVFPGQAGVVATGDVAGLLTSEAAAAGGTASYSFTASQPGTYLYQSGTQPDLQIEMGLIGTLIVRPTGFDEGTDAGRRAYGAASSAYDREYLFFESEMDRCLHQAEDVIQRAGLTPPDPTTHNPPDVCTKVDPASTLATLWFLNGRNGPDTMLRNNVGWMPLQPYNALARIHPGERALMRIVAAGREMHPFHHHGNNTWLIARDGRVLESAPGADAPYPDFQNSPPIPELVLKDARVPDQAMSNFTIQTVPGNTYDALFTWTGKGLNWDIYGHTGADCVDPEATRELNEEPAPGSHCRPFPVTLPEQQALTFGGFWGGSPFLQRLEALPPLQGGLNPGGGYTFMWHSHTERELTNDDIFPGGMMTMMIIEGPGVPIDADGNID
jgi:hypothetical protein